MSVELKPVKQGNYFSGNIKDKNKDISKELPKSELNICPDTKQKDEKTLTVDNLNKTFPLKKELHFDLLPQISKEKILNKSKDEKNTITSKTSLNNKGVDFSVENSNKSGNINNKVKTSLGMDWDGTIRKNYGYSSTEEITKNDKEYTKEKNYSLSGGFNPYTEKLSMSSSIKNSEKETESGEAESKSLGINLNIGTNKTKGAGIDGSIEYSQNSKTLKIGGGNTYTISKPYQSEINGKKQWVVDWKKENSLSVNTSSELLKTNAGIGLSNSKLNNGKKVFDSIEKANEYFENPKLSDYIPADYKSIPVGEEISLNKSFEKSVSIGAKLGYFSPSASKSEGDSNTVKISRKDESKIEVELKLSASQKSQISLTTASILKFSNISENSKDESIKVLVDMTNQKGQEFYDKVSDPNFSVKDLLLNALKNKSDSIKLSSVSESTKTTDTNSTALPAFEIKKKSEFSVEKINDKEKAEINTKINGSLERTVYIPFNELGDKAGLYFNFSNDKLKMAKIQLDLNNGNAKYTAKTLAYSTGETVFDTGKLSDIPTSGKWSMTYELTNEQMENIRNGEDVRKYMVRSRDLSALTEFENSRKSAKTDEEFAKAAALFVSKTGDNGLYCLRQASGMDSSKINFSLSLNNKQFPVGLEYNEKIDNKISRFKTELYLSSPNMVDFVDKSEVKDSIRREVELEVSDLSKYSHDLRKNKYPDIPAIVNDRMITDIENNISRLEKFVFDMDKE